MKKLFLSILAFFILFKVEAQPDYITGLSLFYTFSENVNDMSGKKNDGINTGGKYVKGVNGQAIYFDGQSYITIPGQNLTFNNYTYALWVKLSELPIKGTYASILSIGSTEGDQAIGVCNDCLGGEGWGIISYPNISYSSGILPDKDVWYHVAVTRNNNNMKLYINGKIIGGSGTFELPTYGNNPSGKIGARHDLSSPLTGTVDEIRIYNRPLTSEDVTELYNSYSIITATSKIDSINEILLYPSPTKDKIFIRDIPNGENRFFLIDACGRVMLEKIINSNDYSLDVSFLPRGVYIVKINNSINKIVVE